MAAILPLLILLLFSIPFFILLLKKSTKKHNKLAPVLLPPSPPKLPIIGHLQLLGRLPHRTLHSLSLSYGPLIYLQLGQIPAILVSSSAVAHEIFKDRDIVFASRPSLHAAERLTYNFRNVTFAPYGQYWRQVRKICVLHLLSVRRVQSFRPSREAEALRLVNRISTAVNSQVRDVNLSEFLNDYTYGVMHRAALGRKCSGEGESKVLQNITHSVLEVLAEISVDDFFPVIRRLFGGFATRGTDRRIEKIFEKLDIFVDGIVERHMADHSSDDNGGDGEDFVDVLLSLQKDDSIEFSHTKNDIKALIMNMFGAGTGTTFISLSWAMSELLRNPKVMVKLQQEVRSTAGKKTLVTEEDTNQMPYLRAVIKEVLRLHPPAPLLLPRESIESTELLGYQIPAKTRVIVNAWAIGRDPQIWDFPEEFIPERFIERHIDFRGTDLGFVPFGGGRRICPGIQFGLATIEIGLANLVYHFNWKLPGGMSSDGLNMEEAPGLATQRKYDLILVPETAAVNE